MAAGLDFNVGVLNKSEVWNSFIQTQKYLEQRWRLQDNSIVRFIMFRLVEMAGILNESLEVWRAQRVVLICRTTDADRFCTLMTV